LNDWSGAGKKSLQFHRKSWRWDRSFKTWPGLADQLEIWSIRCWNQAELKKKQEKKKPSVTRQDPVKNSVVTR